MPETIVISNSVFIVLSLELLFSLALPIAAIVVWKKKADVSLRPCVLGAVAFFVFAVVLEQIIHFLVLGLNGHGVGFHSEPAVALRRLRRLHGGLHRGERALPRVQDDDAR